MTAGIPELNKALIHKAFLGMLKIEEIGSGLPRTFRSYEVRLHTNGSTITLCNYKNTGGHETAHVATESARKYFANQITDRLHTLIGIISRATEEGNRK